MRPLNIAVVAFPSHGGSGIVGFESGRLLAKRGHSVSFVSSGVPLRATAGERGCGMRLVNVVQTAHPFFSPAAYAWALTTALLDLHAAEPLDVIHVHYAVPHSVSAALVRQTLGASKPALVTTLHGTDVTQQTVDESQRVLTAWALEQCDALVAPSEFLRKSTAVRFDYGTEERIRVIGNFVDLDTFSPGGMKNTPTLVHVSNLRPVKRGLDVVSIFAQARLRVAELRLEIVGDGPDRSEIENRVGQLGLEDVVRFTGVDVDIADRLREASVFLLPSESESFGLAALEAMACGVPVVASQVGGLPEVIKHGEGGFLHPVGATDEMAASVVKLVADSDFMSKQRAAARERAEQIGAPEPILDLYEKLYRTLSV